MRNTLLQFSDSQRNFFSPLLRAGKGVGALSEKILQVTLENIYILNVCSNNGFRGNSSCESVKWHQNTAAAKTKAELKTQITLRLCKKQKSFPYHSMLSFFLKVR